MGVPVLTLKGNNFVSRCGYSINKNLNLEQLIAKDKKDYIEKAINLASSSNLKNLNTLRNSLRKKAMVSPLFNTSELAENFSKELIKISNRDHS
jgi:predicted O-linked N-acetylglucosamine transferase (SPINDLY family)